MQYTTIDGTRVIFTDKLEEGDFQFCRQFLFVGKGTNLLDLAVTLDEYDAVFLKKCAIAPLDAQ